MAYTFVKKSYGIVWDPIVSHCLGKRRIPSAKTDFGYCLTHRNFKFNFQVTNASWAFHLDLIVNIHNHSLGNNIVREIRLFFSEVSEYSRSINKKFYFVKNSLIRTLLHTQQTFADESQQDWNPHDKNCNTARLDGFVITPTLLSVLLFLNNVSWMFVLQRNTCSYTWHY